MTGINENFNKLVASNVANALEGKTFANGEQFDKEKSIFMVDENGTVSVDLDGDGNFDVTVDNVMKKKGRKIDTDYKDYEIKEIKDSTGKINETKAELEQLKIKENPDDENGLAQQIKKKQAEADTLKLQAGAKEQELQVLKNNLEAVDTKTPDEDDSKKSFRAKKRQERKAIKELIEKKEEEIKQINEEIKTKNREIKSMEKELENIPKTRMKLNSRLEKLGYNKDSRKSLRENGTVISDITDSVKNKIMSFKDNILSLNDQIKNQALSFIQQYNESHPNQKIDVKDVVVNSDGSIDIKSDDGDDRADFNINGLFNKKTGEISLDSKEIKIEDKQGSTSQVKFLQGKIDEYNRMGQDAIQSGDYSKASELFQKAAAIKIEMEKINYTEERFQ